ncbi:zinc-binding protein A33-like [Rhinoraja longicauda]
MASAEEDESLAEELICPVCLDIFTDPVSLQCGHNYCRSCITQCWDKEGRNSCPKCRKEFADRTLIGNWALSSLAEKTHKLKLNQKEEKSKLHCKKHQEELKLFCETDKILVCVVCRDAREHRDHRFIPVEEAVENYKREEQRSLKEHREAEAKSLDIMEKNLQAIQEKLNSMQEKLTNMQNGWIKKTVLFASASLGSLLFNSFFYWYEAVVSVFPHVSTNHTDQYLAQIKSSLQSLSKKNSEIKEMEQLQKKKISGVWEQFRSVQSHITSEFTKKRQILAEEEQRLLKDLREAEAKSLDIMEKNLQTIQEKLNAIEEKLTKMQERMDQKDSVTFLMEEIHWKRRISDEVHTLSVEDGGLEVAKFDRPFLLNRMLSELSCGSPEVSVTLDVETAHPRLEVSEDRKRVRRTWTGRSLPDTRKRFTDRACVLGSEGFTSGRHYWEVEVAGSERWSLGVAAEAVERKRRVTLTPETGVWSIERDVDEFNAVTSRPSPLPAQPIPGRVGVYLSYETGTVSFYDADNKSHLHTFTGNKFTEKLYPFFATWHKAVRCPERI